MGIKLNLGVSSLYIFQVHTGMRFGITLAFLIKLLI